MHLHAFSRVVDGPRKISKFKAWEENGRLDLIEVECIPQA